MTKLLHLIIGWIYFNHLRWWSGTDGDYQNIVLLGSLYNLWYCNSIDKTDFRNIQSIASMQ